MANLRLISKVYFKIKKAFFEGNEKASGNKLADIEAWCAPI
jgi:hypothetical protein